MTRDQLAAALFDLERHLDTRVEIWRVVVDAEGTPTGQRRYVGSIQRPTDWQPPTLEALLAGTKTERSRHD